MGRGAVPPPPAVPGDAVSSGGGGYSVAENQARLDRMRQAAVVRSRQVQARQQRLEDAVRARRARGRRSAVSVPTAGARPADSASTEDHNRWADSLEAQLRLAEGALAAAETEDRAAALAAHLKAVASSSAPAARYVAPAASSSATPAPTATSAAAAAVPEEEAPEVVAATVAGVVSRLTPDATAAERATVERLAEEAVTAAAGHRATLVTELKFRVQDIAKAASRRAEQARRAERLLRTLDGIDGAEVDDLREGLQRVCAGRAELAGTDETRVATARAKAIAEEDSRYVGAELAAAFANLGYQVDDLLATASSGGGVAYAFLPGSDDHAVELRFEHGRYDYRVVRATEASDPVDDAQLEQGVCKDVGLVTAAAYQRGIRTTLSNHRPPGSAPVPYIAAAGQRRAIVSTRRLQEREHPR